MTAGLSIVMLLASLAAGDTPAVEDPSGASKVVANRSPGPGAASPSAVPAGEAGFEDRPVERRGGRVSRPADGAGSVTAGGTAGAASSGWFGRVQGLWPLAVVLALIGALALLAKRILPNRWQGGPGARGMVEILGRQHLSARQSVALLRVGRRVVVIGMTPDKLTHLGTITDPDEVAELVGRSVSLRNGSLSRTFQQEVLREAAAYEPSDHADRSAEAAGLPTERAAAYVTARQQLRGLLSKVRSLTGT
ncbi:MAG: flagellar biosynthetic protein FliO [Phycisphaerae bacterium]